MTDTLSIAELSKVLEDFGFTGYEAKVYLELSRIGQTTVGPLVRSCKLHRQFVYSALERLEDRGFVSHLIKKNRKNFFSTRPDLLLQRETERYRQMQMILPQLRALGAKGDEDIQIQVFSGADEFFNNLLTVIDSAARFDKIIRIIGGGRDSDPYSSIGNRYAEYVNYAKSKGVKKHLIAPRPPGSEHLQRFVKESRNQYRYLEHGLSSPSYTRITPELVTIEIFGKDVVTVQIWNKTIAKSYFEHFELLWNSAVPKAPAAPAAPSKSSKRITSPARTTKRR